MRRFFNTCLKETFCPVGLITCRAMQQLVIRRLKKQMILYSIIQTDKSTGVAYLVILLSLTRYINDSTVQEELELQGR